MILNKCLVAVLALALCSGAAYGHKPADMGRKDREIPQQQWTGKKVAFLGDSEHDFIRQLKKYASSNQKYSILHPE